MKNAFGFVALAFTVVVGGASPVEAHVSSVASKQAPAAHGLESQRAYRLLDRQDADRARFHPERRAVRSLSFVAPSYVAPRTPRSVVAPAWDRKTQLATGVSRAKVVIVTVRDGASTFRAFGGSNGSMVTFLEPTKSSQ